jgi:hypothetical protein
MGKITKLKHAQHQQQRLAFLALIADRPQPESECLDNETLAALVEGRLDRATTDACMAHLADCEACLTLWMRLDTYWQNQQKTNRPTTLHRFLSKPKVLAATGSLLAVAASVAVFVQITLQPTTDSLPLQYKVLPQAEHPSDSIPALPPSEPETLRQSETSTQKMSTASEARQSFPAPPADSNQATTREEESIVPPAIFGESLPRKAKRGTVSSFATPQASDQSMRLSATAPSITHWQRMIQQGCHKTPAPSFFLDIALYGQLLLKQKGTGSLSTRQRHQIKTILQQIKKTEHQPDSQRCSIILPLVDDF